MPRSIAFAASLLLFLSSFSLADGPADNIPANVRRVPKLGIEVQEEKRKELEAGLAKLRSRSTEPGVPNCAAPRVSTK